MTRRGGVGVLLALLVAMLLSGASAVATTPPQPFQTGFLDDALFQGASASLGFQRAAGAGATIDRLRVWWDVVAPAGSTMPAGFDPTNPDDPHYNWGYFDAEVNAAVAAGQTPVANIIFSAPPAWALSQGTYPATYPDPAQFADFAYAAAQRYDGAHGHPRIMYWEIFNEPNLGLYIEPQFVNGQPESAVWYRDVVNRSAVRIKFVHADNFVIAGSTAPYYDQTPSTLAVNTDWGPLGFMRAVLCLTPQLTLVPGCPKITFDAWSHHPYPEGGPTHQASLPDDVSLAELPKLKQVLDAAWAAGEITAPTEPQLWMTEFGWAANPPTPGGVPVSLLQRWIPEAIYDMWGDGVSVLTWFQLVDSSPVYPTGLYASMTDLANDQPKPILEAFRFPFVAYQSAGGVRFWGRTPAGTQATVAIEQEDGSGWQALGQVTSDGYGIFQGRFATSSLLPVRARLTDTGEAGIPFSLRLIPDRLFPVFGHFQFEPSRTYLPRPTIPARWRP